MYLFSHSELRKNPCILQLQSWVGCGFPSHDVSLLELFQRHSHLAQQTIEPRHLLEVWQRTEGVSARIIKASKMLPFFLGHLINLPHDASRIPTSYSRMVSTHRNLQNPATSKVSALQTATKSDGSGWKNIQIPSNLWKTGAQGRHQACFLENEKKGFAHAWLRTMQAKVKQ